MRLNRLPVPGRAHKRAANCATCGIIDPDRRNQCGARATFLVAIFCILAVATGCEGVLGVDADPDRTGGPGGPGGPGETEEVEPSLHRLNRLEYNNSLRDLLGTDLRPADNFPPDASVGGFDNISSALGITPALMDRYVETARIVVEDSFADRPAFEARIEEDDPRLTYTIDRDSNIIGGVVRLRNGRAQGTVTVPQPGPHTLVVRAQGFVNGTAAAPRIRVTFAGQNFDWDVPMGAMEERSFGIELPAGDHGLALQSLNFEEDAPANTGNDIMVDWVVIRSDETVEGPARSRLMTCDLQVGGDACARDVIERFAYQAWRRPLDATSRQRLFNLHADVRAAGEADLPALQMVLRAILTSPKFIYRYRTIEDNDSATLLDPYVLASRLSYFIWSSTPDDRLLQAAEDGVLSDPQGIRDTVAWMLEDPRSQALADGFAEQWLDLRHLEQAAPNPEVYPSFNEGVRRAMERESKLFFLDFVQQEHPVAAMLQPGFIYRNAELAAHLGEEREVGEEITRVSVGPSERQGVLSLSAWLTARSDSEHSSPIRRGSWVADNMLCRPVPPPPAGLEIGELPEEMEGMTLRQRLELHRSEPACAGCHSYLDVLGMGFEVYDGVGRPRDEPELDSLGELPDGETFRGASEMAEKLDDKTFVRCVSKKLFTYALGRELARGEFDEVPEFTGDQVITMSLADLVTSIVLTPAFSEPKPLE